MNSGKLDIYDAKLLIWQILTKETSISCMNYLIFCMKRKKLNQRSSSSLHNGIIALF